MAFRYLIDDFIDAPAVGSIVDLTGEEAHHAAVVARTRIGETLSVGDGRGRVVVGTVEAASRERVTIRVAESWRESRALPAITLVQALAKTDRDELAIQAATELGVDRIVPWQAARSVSRWDEKRRAKHLARWQTIVREASKQSMRAFVPEVDDLVTTKQLAQRIAEEEAVALILEPSATDAMAEAVRNAGQAQELVLVVGPEGGVDPSEIAVLETAGARAVRLGNSVLRTSTAGPAAIAATLALIGRWDVNASDGDGSETDSAMEKPPRLGA